MKQILVTAILPVLAACSYAQAQSTGPRATPQTQRSVSSGISGVVATGQSGTSGQARRSPNTGSPTDVGAAQRAGRHTRAQPRASAVNSSVGVIGGGEAAPTVQGTESAALPGVITPHNAVGIAAGTPILVRLEQPIDSGHAKNGDTVRATLAAPLGKFPSGTPISMTVVASAPAGRVSSSGVLSLQVVSVNGEHLLSQVITAEGKEGLKLLPDAAPERGTEAVFTPDQTFTVPAA